MKKNHNGKRKVDDESRNNQRIHRIGMQNLGLTCYMNSVFMFPGTGTAEGTKGYITLLIRKIFIELHPSNKNPTCDISYFINKCKIVVNEDMDANEFLMSLLECIQLAFEKSGDECLMRFFPDNIFGRLELVDTCRICQKSNPITAESCQTFYTD